MPLYITSLNSGSNGNSYYVGNDNEAVLIDAGISCREIEKRMKRLNLDIRRLKAVFVTHEHTDHIKGLNGLVKKYRLPAYITAATLKYSGCGIDKSFTIPFLAYQHIKIGELTLTPFPKCHDASDPYSFMVTCKETNVGIFTDIGVPCKNVIKYFKQCNAAFLEANYDEEMLTNSSYPYYLKKRISGGNGHLSNSQALDLFKTHKAPFMSHIFLSHLSKNNNCPNFVKDLFNKHSNGVEVVIASRYNETEVYQVVNNETSVVKFKKAIVAPQLSFSFA